MTQKGSSSSGSGKGRHVERCTFCEKRRDHVSSLIAGPPGIYICNECIEICNSILQEEHRRATGTPDAPAGASKDAVPAEAGPWAERELPTPIEIARRLDEYVIGVFFAWLEAQLERLLARDPEALTEAILRSCQNKAEIVAADEREAGGRALLNLGHTFGHAIEAAVGYGQWLHGEAVAAGMVLAAACSVRLGWLDEAALERLRRLLERARLPVEPPAGMTPEAFLRYMRLDKKVQEGRLRLVLLRGIGEAVVTSAFEPQALQESLAAACR